MLVSVIVPAYNEEKLLPGFLKAVLIFLKKHLSDFELLIIENGSRDKTLEITKNFAKKNKRIRVFHLLKPSYGRALVDGIKKAKGEYIVIFNVDFWDKRFLDLVKVNLLGYDIVSASKNLPNSSDRRPFLRRLVSRCFNFFLRIFFGFLGTDTHGIKIFSRQKALPILKKCRLKSGLFDTEFLIRSQKAGLKILELPVEVREIRPSRFGLKRILETPRDIFFLCRVLAGK